MINYDDKYKTINKLLFFSLTILLPLVFLFTSINFVTYDIKYYEKQFEKFGIPEEVGISESDLLIATQNLLDYIKDARKDLNFTAIIKGEEVEFFSYSDKLHMIDVKNIFKVINTARNYTIILLILIVFLILYNREIKVKISKCFLFSSISDTLPFVILVLLMNINFNKYFTIFHKIFFRNDLWLLDPVTDRLINIFPEEFFSNTAMRILAFYFIVLAIIFVVGVLMTLKNSKKSNTG